jgi:hypothetical protein
MFVLIAHAEADQAAADDLRAFLKSRGLVAETETGARGFRHLQASDVVVALWSQKSVFSAQRMKMERRMLDAWADGRLVLVKLDHGFLPVGLRDLPTVDASFESGRSLSVWPQVERAAKEAMNRALVAAQEELSDSLRTGRGLPGEEAKKKSAEPRETTGVGSGGFPPDELDSLDVFQLPSAPASSSQPVARPGPRVEVGEAMVAANSKRGSPVGVLIFLAGAALVGGSLWLVLNGQEITIPLPTSALGIEGFGDLQLTNLQAAGISAVIGILLALTVMSAGRIKSRRKPQKRAVAAAAAAATTPAEASASGAALFISYAHADNAAVEPVVRVVRANGREVWIDKTRLQTGDGWAGEIVRAIKGAKGMMVMCSPRAFESDHIKREVYLADRYKKPMLPVFLEPAQMPEDFEYFFAGVQWLELFRLDEADQPGAIGKALSAV